MKKLFIPILVAIILLQFILLRLSRDTISVYPSVVLEDGVYRVEIVDDQLEDDSVRAVKYRLELLADEFGQWYVDEQSSTFACWEGRGHEEFSSEFCE